MNTTEEKNDSHHPYNRLRPAQRICPSHAGSYLQPGATGKDRGDHAFCLSTTDTGWIAHVTSIDTFGNLTTDLPTSILFYETGVRFRLRGVEVGGISNSFGDRLAGENVAVIDSEEFFEIALVNGNAAQ